LRRFLALALLLGAALAACGDRPYTLETPQGLAGGEALSYQKGVLTLEEACFLGEGLAFEAELLRFDKKTGEVFAKAPKGTFRGWRFSAERLWAREERLLFDAPRFFREGVALAARRAEAAEGKVWLEGLGAEAFGYRFRAKEGVLTKDRFVAEELWATPCQKGEALLLLGERAVFDLETKRLLVEESRVRYYGFCLARPDALLLDLARPLNLRSPFVFAVGEGVTLGIRDWPLWEPGVPLGAGSTRISAVVESLMGSAPRVRFGVRRPELSLLSALTLGDAPRFALSLKTQDARFEVFEGGSGYLELAPAFGFEKATVAPFAAFYGAPEAFGVYAGALFKARVSGEAAGGRFTVEPRARLAFIEAPLAALGGRAAWRKGPFSLSLSGTLRLSGAGFYPVLAERERLALDLRYGPAWAYARYDFDGESGYLGALYEGPYRVRVQKGLGALSERLELALARASVTPPAGGLAFMPELGYDFGLDRLSRAGLTVAYGDGCLVYRLSLRYVALPWPGELSGWNLSLGVALP